LATAGSTQLKAFSEAPMIPVKYLVSLVLHWWGMGKRGSGKARPSMRFFVISQHKVLFRENF